MDNEPNLVEIVKYLWEEYKYRHDLIWRLIFRLTFAVVILAVVPYGYSNVVLALGKRALFVPAIAPALIVLSFFLMFKELSLFKNIANKYEELQANLGIVPVRKWPHFRDLVMTYLLCLLILSLANLILLSSWIDGLKN